MLPCLGLCECHPLATLWARLLCLLRRDVRAVPSTKQAHPHSPCCHCCPSLLQMAVSFIAAMFLVIVPAVNEALDHRAVWAVSAVDAWGTMRLPRAVGSGQAT